jgi:hypothetical protein
MGKASRHISDSDVDDGWRLGGHMAHGFLLLSTHDWKKWFSSLTPLSHKEYTTFGDDKKGKLLGTGVIKVNGCFTLNDVTLVDRLRYNMFSVSQLCVAGLSVLFASLIHMFLILLANLFVASLALEMFFELISHLLNLL